MADYATNFALLPDEWLLALLNVPNRKIPKHVGSQLKHHAEVRGRRIWDILPEFHADDMKTHRALREVMNDLQSINTKIPSAKHAGDAIQIVRHVTDFDGWLRRDAGDDRDNDRLQNIQRMQSAASHYKTIREYLDAVQKVRDEAARRKTERQKKRRELDEVCLSTGHSAKGLEWKCVFAIGWSEEILPHHRAEDISEERRIAYVIATRAKDILRISSLETWNDAITSPSRFLTGMKLTPPPADAGASGIAPVTEPETPGELGGLFMPA
jgi:superfamily I DNA/RNA helicase